MVSFDFFFKYEGWEIGTMVVNNDDAVAAGKGSELRTTCWYSGCHGGVAT